MAESPAEAAAIRDARRRLYKDKRWAEDLRNALLEHLSDAIGEQDAVRTDMFAASIALVDDMMRGGK